MEICYYPIDDPQAHISGPVANEISSLKRLDPALWNMVARDLKDLSNEPDLGRFGRQGKAVPMKYRDSLWELRIPSGKRDKGVFRIYFCFDSRRRQTIWLVAAEYKAGGRKKKQHDGEVIRAEKICVELRMRLQSEH